MTAQSYDNLHTRALQIKNETAGFANTELRVGSLLVDIIDSASALALSTVSSSANTLLIQAAIDAAHAAYLAGSGITDVRLPSGVFSLAESVLGETYWNDGVSVSSTNTCLVMRDGVALRGAGVGRTTLRVASPADSAIFVVDGNHQAIYDLTIDGNGDSVSTTGHGIIQILSANNAGTLIEDLRVERVYVHHVGSYGLGLQNGICTNFVVRDFTTYRTGADGIDIKNRGTSEDDKGFRLENIYIDTFGLRLDDQAGVDIRGICTLSGVQVINAGRAGAQQTAIRFRAREAGTSEPWARRSSLQGFYIRSLAGSPANTNGVWVGCPDVAVNGGTIESVTYGVRIVGDAIADASDRVSFSQVNVISATTGFWVDDTFSVTSYARLLGCLASNCATSFFDEGRYTIIDACTSFNASVAALTTDALAVPTQLIGLNQFSTSAVRLDSSNAGLPTVKATGAATNIDLGLEAKGTGAFVLSPNVAAGVATIEVRGAASNLDIELKTKGTGRLKYGTKVVTGDVPITGYIEVLDSGGTVRRLAVVG